MPTPTARTHRGSPEITPLGGSTSIVRDMDRGPVSGATGRAQINFTLTPS